MKKNTKICRFLKSIKIFHDPKLKYIRVKSYSSKSSYQKGVVLFSKL